MVNNMSITELLALPEGTHMVHNPKLGREVKVFRLKGLGFRVIVEYENWTARLISYNEQGEYLGQQYLGEPKKNSRMNIVRINVGGF